MRHSGMRVAGVLLVGVAGWLLLGSAHSAGGTDGKAFLPADEFTALVKQDAKVLEELLAKGAPDKKDKKTPRKVRAAAFMIAAYARANATKDNAAEMATLHNAALKILKLQEDGKYAEATDLAKALPLLKADASAKLDPAALGKAVDFGDVMHQFSSERVGGFGIEKELNDLSEEKTLTPAQVERIGTLAFKMGVIGHVSVQFKEEMVDKEKPEKTAKNWVDQSNLFHKAAVELATVARTKNAVGTLAALEKVGTSCVKCHDIFK